MYNPSTDAWQSISLDDAPSDRIHHTAVWTGEEMIIWGGVGYDSSQGRLFSYNTGGRYRP